MPWWSCIQVYFPIKKTLLVSGSPLTSGLGRLLTELMCEIGTCEMVQMGFRDWLRDFVTRVPVLYLTFGLTKGTSSLYSLMRDFSYSVVCKKAVTPACKMPLDTFVLIGLPKNILISYLLANGSPFASWAHLCMIYGVDKLLIDVTGRSSPHYRWLQATH